MSYDMVYRGGMDTVVIAGDQVRVPDQTPGTATAVRRYDNERAFVLHPDDFHRLVALEDLVASALELDPLALTDAAVAAHFDESSPGEPVTDPAQINALLGR